ncbi:hypothetical protein VKT23_004778 [Stygiomarasmius scandens]|uniref:Fungal N-terminal domain-containing protein n=1 Tax=Marasmiellus scandens TaxID=2682957 RepID=A0ABR1JTA5_9AGAR
MRLRGSRTSNILAVLSTLKDVGDIAANIPYIKAVAGILSTLIGIHLEFDQCKEEWKVTMECIKNISALADDFLAEQDRNGDGEVPVHVRKAFDSLVASIQVTCLSLDKYQSLSRGERLWKRRELRDEAKNCVEVISGAETRLHTNLLGPMAVQVDQILNIVQSQRTTDASVAIPGSISSSNDATSTEDLEEERLKAHNLYIEQNARLNAGSGGDEENGGIGGSGGGIAINNLRSKLAFRHGVHVSAGDGGEGKHTGEGGRGGVIGADNIHSTQHFWGTLNAGKGGSGDGGVGGAGGNIGAANVETTQDFRGSLEAGSGGASKNSGTGGVGGSIGTQNQNMTQSLRGQMSSSYPHS